MSRELAMQRSYMATQQRAAAVRTGAPAGAGIMAGVGEIGLPAATIQRVRATQAPPVAQATMGTPIAIGSTLATGAAALAIPALIGLLGGDPQEDVGGIGLGGLQFPWETPEGEGFIAPWTQQTALPSGLVGQEGKQYAGQMGSLAGVGIAYYWDAGTTRFYRLVDGRIACYKKNGVLKVWRPKKHYVIPKSMSKMPLGKIIKVDRMLDRFMRFVAKRSKKLKLQ